MNRIEIDCIFCGKDSERIAWEENGFTGKRCECGLLYVSPRPSLKEMTEWYNSKEANLNVRSGIESEFSSRLNSRYRLNLLEKYRTKGRILEIGPGGGYFLDESRRAGFEPFGVELNLLQAKFIKEQLRIPVETNPFTESSFSGINFDIICHFDVLSHFYNPFSEFKTFNRRLKEGGILFFETGNGGDLSPRWLKFIGRLQYPQHLFLFSKKNIEQLCACTGFEIIRIYQYSIFLQLLIIKLMGWVRKSGERFILRGEEKAVSKNSQEIPKKCWWWKVLPLKSVLFLNFFIRYGIGRILPRFGPQTIIYIVKKVATVD
jgi:2-polyprenyl-3-methyl-5-hydroxy-6-metoxy-1,4-benzoquinol methylase